MDIQLTTPRIPPIILTKAWQLSLVSLGIFFLTVFGAVVVTSNPVLTLVGLKISIFDLIITSIVVFLLFVIAC